jgi:hypothetical protein
MFMVGTYSATHHYVYRYIRNIRGKLKAGIRVEPVYFRSGDSTSVPGSLLMFGGVVGVGGHYAAIVKPDHQVFCARLSKGLISIPSIGPCALAVFYADPPGRTEHRAYLTLRGLVDLYFFDPVIREIASDSSAPGTEQNCNGATEKSRYQQNVAGIRPE